MRIPRLVIAGTHSGAGKTTVTLGLLAAFSAKGFQVQPFKVGPDFLDPLHHAVLSGRTSRNLDGWMMGRHGVLESFRRASGDADLAVMEGVMGLYDGALPHGTDGSTAQVARWLKAPVVLVVDASGMAGSVAALVRGFRDHDPRVNLAGVLFNRVGSPGHGHLLKTALGSVPGVRVLGGLPEDPGLRLSERHLGLEPPREEIRSWQERLVRWIRSHVDLEAVWALAREAPPLELSKGSPACHREEKARCRVAVARDPAFFFYYPENLELLEAGGAELVAFSPLADPELPKEVDGVYIGGGYPEAYARDLAENRAMRQALRRFAAQGRPVYAECGGLMYLARSLVTLSGESHEMVGIFPGAVRMQDRLASLGYVEVEARAKNPLLPVGARMRGHEFHYSCWIEEPAGDGILRVYRAESPRGRVWEEGYRWRNVLGSYFHLHFSSNPGATRTFIRACQSRPGKEGGASGV